MQKHYTYFSENERYALYKMRERSYSAREIARCPERNVFTLSRKFGAIAARDSGKPNA